MRQTGFTLIELLITVTVLTVMLAIAVPSFSSFQEGSRLTAQANDLVSMLSYARVEALKRGTRVSVCKSSDGASCATSGNWDQGWIVFNDGCTTGTVGVVDTACAETVLKRRMALATGYTLTGETNIASRVTFTSTGAPQQNGTFSLCSAGDDKSVALSGTGRLSVSDTGASCS
jgi:type IV fimbrial biogenesis protein FimT